MNAPFAAPKNGLDTIDALFDSLGGDEQLHLIDHLCSRGGFDLNFYALAYEYAAAHNTTVEASVAEAERITSRSPAERDELLRYHLRAGRRLALTPVRGEAA
jgi:hypothetical protein